MMVEVTTSDDAKSMRNVKISKDEILDQINRRRALMRKGMESQHIRPEEEEGLDLDDFFYLERLDNEKINGSTWGELKEKTWGKPEARSKSTLKTKLQYPCYTSAEWFVSNFYFALIC